MSYTTKTALTLSDRIEHAVDSMSGVGMTVTEVRNMFSEHHGTASGSLSYLHRNHRLALLNEKRGGCRVYVTPEHVFDRETRPHGRNNREAINV